MTYLQAKAIKEEMNDKLNILEAKLKEFQVAGGNGFVPDALRNTPEYKNVKIKFDKLFIEFQQFNKVFVKEFKKEIAKERRSRRVQR